ncbi:MAG: DUF1987 domain-containing protein [Bacteroidales bacterium]|nr:DUF1987 domain-containing protein [Bacteroidales bacterium]
MKNLLIEATKKTPEVIFNTDGQMSLKGRSLPENADQFFSPLISWVESLDVKNVKLDISLDYFNSSSSRKLMDMFKYLDANHSIDSIQINWYYEEGDEDSLETAQIFEESLMRTDFRYLEQADKDLLNI